MLPVLRIKLKGLDKDNKKRRAIAKFYLENISNENIELPEWDFSGTHVFHLFVIRTQEREHLMNYLKNNGIETGIHYPIPPHKQKALKEYSHLSLPITEKMHKEVLSLPIYPSLTSDEQSYICNKMNIVFLESSLSYVGYVNKV